MPLYFLDPEREPRDCNLCRGTGGANCVVNRDDLGRCRDCHGTGRLGVEGAKPEIETEEIGPTDGRVWFYYPLRWDWHGPHRQTAHQRGPYPTELAALEAARAANKERN